VGITARSADYYDRDADTIQLLADTSRAILAFECPEIKKVVFEGFVDRVRVFGGTAEEAEEWAIQTDPGPLEALALFYTAQEPSFFHLGNMNAQMKPFLGVEGIFKTEQFKDYNAQAVRMMRIVDGDVAAFTDYLRNPGRSLGSFNNAQAHYKNVLEMIRIFSPQLAPAYAQAYETVIATLRDDYWSSRVAILEESDFVVPSAVISDARGLLAADEPDFNSYVDSRLADIIRIEIEGLKNDLPDATLYELELAADFLADLPASENMTRLPKARHLIATESETLVELTTARLAQLYEIALLAIEDSGTSHEDVDAILDTTFALAEEFEETGFVNEGTTLIAAGTRYVETVLDSGLADFKAEIGALDYTPETAASLQQQAALYSDLAESFPGFSAYSEAIENALAFNRSRICEAILREAGASEELTASLLVVSDEPIRMTEFACDLYQNQNMITELSALDTGLFTDTAYALAIDEADGARKRVRLEEDQDGLLVAVADITGETPTDLLAGEWDEYVARLIIPPPTGKPDRNGIRECDTLAADPADPHKRAEGVDFISEDVDPDSLDRALDACIAAVENDPTDTVQTFQLGRLLWITGDPETAAVYIEQAAEAGYPAAQYHRAEILLAQSTDQNSFVDALDLFEAAGNGGYEPGRQMVAELNPSGMEFFKEIPAPTPSEIVAALSEGAVKYSALGVSASQRVVGVTVKDCFQTNATDFACEYKPKLKCSMGTSLYGNSDAAQLINKWISNMAQAECNQAMDAFDTFRKISEDQWKKMPSQF
jgi:hypothetical protein